MQPVNQLKDLGESVMYFSGRTLDEALKAEQDFAIGRKAQAQRYFVQRPFGGTKLVNIIADYVRA
jgi:hypothetical protein